VKVKKRKDTNLEAAKEGSLEQIKLGFLKVHYGKSRGFYKVKSGEET